MKRQLVTFPKGTRCLTFLDSGQQITMDLPHRRYNLHDEVTIRVSLLGTTSEQQVIPVSDGSGTYYVSPNMLTNATIEDWETAE